jgi:Tfp pilus assembly protein PilE
MEAEKKNFTLLERMMVVAILLFAAAIAIQDLIHSVKVSEEKKVGAAETEYSAVRNMFAEQYRADSAGASGANTTRASFVFNSASH